MAWNRLAGRGDDGGAERSAVIDIGSNSVRLVVYGAPRRLPVTLFNEKVLCGLGGSLERTGKLDPDGVELATAALERFVALARDMAADPIHAIATAAVRDAADGPDFVAAMEARTGIRIRVVDGTEEARLSAMGVLSGHPEARGVVGDLGGASLELVALDGGEPAEQATLPLGPLRLAAMDQTGDKLTKKIDGYLRKLDWLERAEGLDFYPVGGAWRALARIHMAQRNYALRIIDRYTLPRAEIEDVLELIAKQSKASLRKLAGVPAKRVETLPNAALLMSRLLAHARPARLVFSAFGLREGVLYDALDPETRAADPLAEGSVWLGGLLGRDPAMGAALVRWMAPLLAGEEPRWAQIARAACHLSDLGWTEHPGYRAQHAFFRVLRTPVPGLGHAERGFLALAVYGRYGGNLSDVADEIAPLGVDDELAARALALGRALRLGYALAGAVPSRLDESRLARERERLLLVVPEAVAPRLGETVQRRLDAAAKAFGLASAIISGEGPGTARVAG